MRNFCDFFVRPSSFVRLIGPIDPKSTVGKLIALSAFICGMGHATAAEFHEPVVARVEMKLAVNEKVVDVIEKGDLLTVVEERKEDYVIMTHDGSKGAVEKSNAVRIIESADVYTELIEKNREEGRYYTLRASAWWAMGKVDKALEDFDKAIELGYEESHAYTSRGLFHAEMGNFQKAIDDYNQALEIDSEDLAPIINRAAAHMSMGKHLDAVNDYTLVLKEKEGSTSLLHQRAIAFKMAGKLEEAATDFSSILEQSPEDYRAIMGRGYVHFQQQNFSDAVEDFGKAVELNPKDAVAWNNRGYNRNQIGEFEGALEDYNEAIKLAPKYALAYQNRAWLLATASDEVRDAAAAVESAKAACEVTNYTAVADLSALAAALAADGKFDKAVGWQEKVIELVGAPYKDFAKKTLARYENKRPFASDPDQANADEQAAAEAEAKEKQQAKKSKEENSPKA
jgi:tetratricopeptide (TPR) repeat protein